MKKKLLLHICCAPDEVYVLHKMSNEFDLHAFFCNPNIQPEKEYNLRLNEAKRVAEMYNVPFSSDEYLPEVWDEKVKQPWGHTPEKGARCYHCFDLRLDRTAKFCAEIGWESFTSVLSMSPQKRVETIFSAGENAAKRYNVTFEPYNFKKQDGYLHSIKLSKKYDLYRQDYCGCILSKNERDLRLKSRENENG